ncbi:MAG TPA: ATP-binding cassette domain-containing protein, partial [Terriglobales bacterium]
IGVLSGGERNRYALARMLLQPSNFLLLDEPTNHLDLRAKDVLLEALQKFTGTVVFVSHDRYFIDKLATRVFEVADGAVNIYPGNYEDYLYRKEGAADAELASASAKHKAAEPEPVPVAEQNAENANGELKKRLNPIKMRQLTDRCNEVEASITRLEAEIADTEQAMAQFVSAEETQKLFTRMNSLREQLDVAMKEWEELSSVLESHA